MEVTVKTKFNGTAPRKLRLVADLVRGWQAQKALDQLRFVPKAAAQDIAKTLQSAIGAAKEANMALDNSFIKTLMVNEGPALKRRVYMARGRASVVKKRMSHIVITLSEKEITKTEDKKAAKKETSEVKVEEKTDKKTEETKQAKIASEEK